MRRSHLTRSVKEARKLIKMEKRIAAVKTALKRLGRKRKPMSMASLTLDKLKKSQR